MIYPSIDKLLNIVSSKYELAHIAARRSKEMSKEEHYQLPINEYKCYLCVWRSLIIIILKSQDYLSWLSGSYNMNLDQYYIQHFLHSMSIVDNKYV